MRERVIPTTRPILVVSLPSLLSNTNRVHILSRHANTSRVRPILSWTLFKYPVRSYFFLTPGSPVGAKILGVSKSAYVLDVLPRESRELRDFGIPEGFDLIIVPTREPYFNPLHYNCLLFCARLLAPHSIDLSLQLSLSPIALMPPNCQFDNQNTRIARSLSPFCLIGRIILRSRFVYWEFEESRRIEECVYFIVHYFILTSRRVVF